MRLLILDHYYPEFVERALAADPGLERTSFKGQHERFDSGLFGETQFQAAALRALGHEALHFPINVPSLASAWAREHGVRLPRRAGASIRLRRGWLPWPALEERRGWLAAVLGGLVDTYEPDAVHVQCLDVLDSSLIAGLRRRKRLLTGQTAAPRPNWDATRVLDLVFSSLPNYVARVRGEGGRATLLPLAFPPEVAGLVGAAERDVGLSFVGSVSPSHTRRTQLLSEISGDMAIDLWGPTSAIPGARVHAPVYGRAMYEVLSRSRMTLNVHGEHAEGYANNLRLFEATGMGAMLLTESAPNLGQLFQADREVVTYRDAASLKSAVTYYTAHPDEARAIADAGQQRTLGDHTWDVRMSQMMEVIEDFARGRPVGRQD